MKAIFHNIKYIDGDAGTKNLISDQTAKLPLRIEQKNYRKFLNIMTKCTISSLPYEDTCSNNVLTD